MRVLNVILGILILGIGVVAIRYPGFGLVTMAMLIGIAWLMEGAVALSTLPVRGRGWWIFFGVVSVLAGISVLVFPWASLFPLLLVTGAFALASGVLDLINAATFRPGRRGAFTVSPQGAAFRAEPAAAAR
jgi:uncharacterized membrane protein HdeD (DUF308 family)